MPSQIKVDEIKNVAGQYKIKTNILEGQTTANNMTINAGNITVQSEGNATTNLQQGLCKHSFTFDQGGNSGYSDVSGATIRDSFNSSSITDVSTGIGEPNFTNNMNDDKYAPVLNSHYHGSTNDSHRRYSRFVAPAKFSTSAFAYGAQYANGSNQDCYMTCHTTGDLA